MGVGVRELIEVPSWMMPTISKDVSAASTPLGGNRPRVESDLGYLITRQRIPNPCCRKP